jgi:zinc-binding alcohol dehydrogenase/oxidoreductase
MGSTMGNDRELDAMMRAFRSGALVPVVDAVFDFEHGREAFERLASKEQFGKVVIRIPE